MAQASLPRRSIFLFLDAGIPLGSGLGGSPHTNRKIGLSPHVPHCFSPKILFCNFHTVFGQFAQIVPPQVGPIWKNGRGKKI